LREQVEDLNDYLDLLEARARNKGKRSLTTAEVRKQLGLA
jgi:cell division protein FtsB